MATNNPWTNPFQRSYQDIRASLIEKLKTRVPEINDYSESNIFVLIISLWSAIAETIHYYIDNMTREAFLPTARRYSSLYKHAKLVDYHIKAAHPASVDLVLYLEGNQALASEILIPVNTVFVDNRGIPWLTTKATRWPKGTFSVKVSVVEKQLASPSLITFGTIPSSQVSLELSNIPAGKQYVEGSMILNINNEPWTLVDTFAYSNAYDKVYKVEINDSNKPTLVFGNGKFGTLPPVGGIVTGNYYLTQGSNSNLDPGAFTTVPATILDLIACKLNNDLRASGGSDYEDFETLKEHIPLSIKTLGVAITKEDFEALTRQIPGVDKAYINYICGRFVEIYITPTGGGEASAELLTEVNSLLSKSKVITTTITVKSTREVQIYIDATITGRKSFKSTDIHNQVVRALVNTYNYNTSDINRPVRFSDLYAKMDSQPLVDYLSINTLYLIPNIEKSGNNPAQLPLIFTQYSQLSFQTANIAVCYLEVLTSSTYRVTYKNDIFEGTFGISKSIICNDFNIEFIVGETGETYNIGDTYSFSVQGMNKDLVPTNYTIPVFDSKNIKLTIHESI